MEKDFNFFMKLVISYDLSWLWAHECLFSYFYISTIHYRYAF